MPQWLAITTTVFIIIYSQNRGLIFRKVEAQEWTGAASVYTNGPFVYWKGVDRCPHWLLWCLHAQVRFTIGCIQKLLPYYKSSYYLDMGFCIQLVKMNLKKRTAIIVPSVRDKNTSEISNIYLPLTWLLQTAPLRPLIIYWKGAQWKLLY